MPETTLTSRRRWLVLATVLIGSLVGTFGNSMMNVALPSIMQHYHVGLNVGVWVVTIYVLLFSTLMPVFGRLGDMLGYKRIYLLGMTGLVIWSALGALAPSIGWLIAFRALAGIFNAPTLPAVMGIIAEVFPANERGGALGYWATVNGVGHGFGPVISGLLVEYFGWPSVFWFNVALTLLGVILIAVSAPSDNRRGESKFDVVGATTLTLMMILFMFNITQGLDQSLDRFVSLALWGACLGLFVIFLYSQSRNTQPFVDLRLFAQRRYGLVTFVSGAQLFCLLGMQLLLPLFLIGVQGRSSGQAGLLIAPLAVTLAVVSPGAGRLSDRVGSRLTCVVGMGIVALAGVGLTFWDAGAASWLIMLTLVLLGFGMGLTQSPTANAVTLVVKREKLGVALGIFNMLRFASGTLGATLFGAILDHGSAAPSGVAAFRVGFYLLIAMAAVAAALSFGLPSAALRPAEIVATKS